MIRTDCESLQADLDLFEYCKISILFLNINRCNYIKFTYLKNNLHCTYSINVVPLNKVVQIKDLGVIDIN